VLDFGPRLSTACAMGDDERVSPAFALRRGVMTTVCVLLAALSIGCSALTSLDFEPPAPTSDSSVADSGATDSKPNDGSEDANADGGSDGASEADTEVDAPCPGTPCDAAAPTCCDGTCADLSGAHDNCGACGKSCTAHQDCNGGHCCTAKTYDCSSASECCTGRCDVKCY
jgi:hypothetical protein